MAENLTANLSISVAPPGSQAAISLQGVLRSEQHTRSIKETIVIPASSTDFSVSLAGLTTVALLYLAGNNPFSYKKGSAAAEAASVRKFALETPDNVALAAIYITTGTQPVELNLLAVGD